MGRGNKREKDALMLLIGEPLLRFYLPESFTNRLCLAY
jgi:hypothetical protein